MLPSNTLSANGLRGFRFGEAAGYVVYDVEVDELSGSIAEGEVVPVVASGAPDICRGTAVRMNGGRVRMCLRFNRLGVRILNWSDIAVVGGDGAFLAVLPKTDSLLDLDIGHFGKSPTDLETIMCASAEAKPFADSEVKRLRIDVACGRIRKTDLDVIARRLASFQAIDIPLCTSCVLDCRIRQCRRQHLLRSLFRR